MIYGSPLIPEVVHEHYLKVPVCVTEDYVIKFEQHLQGTFVHCDVFNWNKSIKEKLQVSWDTVANTHGGPIHALHDLHDQKHQKFLVMFGFKRLKHLPDFKEIWIWSKNG
jgi:hypothetical protein